MKKIWVTISIALMVFSMSIAVFAETQTTNGRSVDISVNGKYKYSPEMNIISAEISWDDMDFTYTAPSKGTWDPKTHQYNGAYAGGWSDNTSVITVENHSNTKICADFTFAPNVTGLIGTFTESSGSNNDNKLEINTAVGTKPDKAPSATAKFGISGSPINSDMKIGTITVNISAIDSSHEEINTTESNPVMPTKIMMTSDEFIQQAKDNTIVLSSNVVLTEPLELSSGMVIDLNNHTLYGDVNDGYMITITDSGNYTIKNGNIIYENSGSAPIYNCAGNLTISKCNISSKGGNAVINCGGSLNVSDSTITIDNIENDEGSAVIYILSGNLNIKGTVTLSGGTAISNHEGSVNIDTNGEYNFTYRK